MKLNVINEDLMYGLVCPADMNLYTAKEKDIIVVIETEV